MFEFAFYKVVEPSGRVYTSIFCGLFGLLLAIKPDRRLPDDETMNLLYEKLHNGRAVNYYGYVIRYVGGF